MGRTPLKKRKKKPSTVFKSKIENRVRINIADISKSICKICLGKKPEIIFGKEIWKFLAYGSFGYVVGVPMGVYVEKEAIKGAE